MIFVFGSNLAGRHGKGAALYAKTHYGAIQFVGFGRQGSSYAIPTKDSNLNVLSLQRIEFYVKEFIKYAKVNPEEQFLITRVGCGLAGYTDEQIAPLFKGIPDNCVIDASWKEFLPDAARARITGIAAEILVEDFIEND